MDNTTAKFLVNSEYFENFPSPTMSSPDHYVITNSDTNSIDWNVSSPLHNQSDFENHVPSELLVFIEVVQIFVVYIPALSVAMLVTTGPATRGAHPRTEM